MASKLAFTIRRITSPSETDIENATNVLATAFEKDECAAIFTTRDPKMAVPFHRMKVTAGFLAGEVHVAEDADDNVIGVAIWFPPGREMLDSEDQLQQALEPFTSRFSIEVREWWDEMFDEFSPEYNDFMAASLGAGAVRKSWTLQVIAVVPEHHHKGVAKALVGTVREKANNDGFAITLEAEQPHNVHIYERLGFQAMGNQEFSNKYGSFTVWAMIHNPPTSRNAADSDTILSQ